MLFNSLQFLIFFPIAVIGYFAIPEKHRNTWLLILSYYFYMCWNAVYAVLIFFSTASTWIFANISSKQTNSQVKRKAALVLSIVLNIAILFFFKYYTMFAQLLTTFFATIGIVIQIPALSLLLPVGISFYTFQALGYAIDVYRGTVEHEKNFLRYALFISFFPQLVAGPIERSSNLLHQFTEKHIFTYDNYAVGMRLMLLGFFKKVVIADNLSIAVERYYANLEIWPGPLLILGIFLFAIQIYCDFSAYSDIARGAAKVMGFELMKNFDHPYFSHSISEFWRRWHISLGSWFRDYLFYPILRSKWCMKWTRKLNKSGHKKAAKVFPVMVAQAVVWLTTGLWHGARMTYVFWGGIHGFYQIIENAWGVYHKKSDKPSFAQKYPKVFGAFQIAGTFFLVCVGYVFFRSESFSQAGYILLHSLRGWGVMLTPVELLNGAISLVGSSYSLYVCLFSMLALLFIELIEMKHNKEFEYLMDKLSFTKRWVVYYVLLFSIAMFGAFGASAFIYFQF